MGGALRIKSKQSGFCVEASRRWKKRGGIHMWPCKRFNKNQHWEYNGDTGQIKNADGICLALEKGKVGSRVWSWPCMPGNSKQTWHYDQRTGLIKNKWSGYCLIA